MDLRRTSDEGEARGEGLEDHDALATEAASEDDGDDASGDGGADLRGLGVLANVELAATILSGIETGGTLGRDNTGALAEGLGLGGSSGGLSGGGRGALLDGPAASQVVGSGPTQLGNTLGEGSNTGSDVLTSLGHVEI